MKAKRILGIVLSIVFLSALPALAGEDLVQTVADGCKAELES
jgi:hypothetical protein